MWGEWYLYLIFFKKKVFNSVKFFGNLLIYNDYVIYFM